MQTDWLFSVNWENVKIGLEKYNSILEYFENINSASKWEDNSYIEFRRRFNGFYRVRRNEDFQRKYYQFLFQNKNNKITFESVLTGIKDLTGQIEASFSSKLLHTINPDMPIWDSEVLKKLGISAPRYIDKDKFSKTVKCYNRIEDWYRTVLSSDEGESMIQIFDTQVAATNNISDTKKIDFMIWQKGR